MFSSFPQQPWENLFWLFLTLPDHHLGQFSGLILSLMAAFPFQVWQLSGNWVGWDRKILPSPPVYRG